MKVFLLTNSYLPQLGGLEIAVYNIAHQLARKGHRVTVIAGTSAINYSKKMQEGRICVYRMPF
ncbi:MAG: glycosyltransferase, partial [Candidatus Omnitrophica bacterium]|nr:glycosyltransferase [Candidatus Omnitrophota bacterium]